MKSKRHVLPMSTIRTQKLSPFINFQAADDDRLCFGTVDSWLLWHLTSGDKSQNHLTDVTNASRTMLMNLKV